MSSLRANIINDRGHNTPSRYSMYNSFTMKRGLSSGINQDLLLFSSALYWLWTELKRPPNQVYYFFLSSTEKRILLFLYTHKKLNGKNDVLVGIIEIRRKQNE